jgi:hypothetical protein
MENPEHEDAPPVVNRAVKLPPIWTANPRAWFTSAEGAFRLRNIADEESRFFNCLHALPETTVSLIADLVEADPLLANPYTELRRRLLAAHQLTDIQRVEQLFNLPPLGAQKPSELLAKMLRLCPRGQENNAFFNCLFPNKLPRELRILLSEAEMADKQALAPGPTSSPPTTASRPTTWWRRWSPFLLRSKKERRPRWLQSAQEPAAGSAAAAADTGAADTGAADGEARRSRDAVVAADSRCPIR